MTFMHHHIVLGIVIFFAVLVIFGGLCAFDVFDIEFDMDWW